LTPPSKKLWGSKIIFSKLENGWKLVMDAKLENRKLEKQEERNIFFELPFFFETFWILKKCFDPPVQKARGV